MRRESKDAEAGPDHDALGDGASGGVIVEGVRHAQPGGGRARAMPSFTLGRGESLAVVGPSGAGKTTLLRLVAGILRPAAGRIMVAGMDMTGSSDGAVRRFRARRIGQVFQDIGLVAYLSGLDNILLPLRLVPRGGDICAAAERAKTLAETFGVAAVLRRLPAAMSVGEQQRIALCRALIADPAVILADEPTASLDRENRDLAFRVLVREAREKQRTLIVATHDDDLLDAFDRRLELPR